MLPAGVGIPAVPGAPVLPGELETEAAELAAGADACVGAGPGAALQAAAIANAQPNTTSRRQGTNDVEMCRR
jgi:hypothetical protein